MKQGSVFVWTILLCFLHQEMAKGSPLVAQPPSNLSSAEILTRIEAVDHRVKGLESTAQTLESKAQALEGRAQALESTNAAIQSKASQLETTTKMLKSQAILASGNSVPLPGANGASIKTDGSGNIIISAPGKIILQQGGSKPITFP